MGRLGTWTLRTHPRGDAVARVLSAAIIAAEPAAAVRRAVKREGEKLTIAGQSYYLRDFRQVVIIAIGKAAWGMASALEAILADRFDSGLIVTKHPKPPPSNRFAVLPGGHPLPNMDSLTAGRRVLELASSLKPDDLLFCLISGGGSALATAPVEGVSLADLRSLTSILLACGARVDEMNILRRALDRVKGGGLAQAANGARIITLIISDVIGDPPEAIASGPTIPDPTTPAQAVSILEKYRLTERTPGSIIAYLRAGAVAVNILHPALSTVEIIASNLRAAHAALAQAEAEGFNPYLLQTDLEGEAREVGFYLATALRWTALRNEPVARPACLVAGGETTVTLRGKGLGGRNTELALAAAIGLADFPGILLATLATDGEDGLTDAAGAVVTGETWGRARSLGIEASTYLDRNDSHTFFSALDDLLQIGSTGTSVNDLTFLFAF